MATAEFDLDPALFAVGSPNAPQPGDDKLFVKFYMGYVENPVKSEEMGRMFYDDVEFVRIMTPGDRNNIIDRPVRPSDKIRFSRQYMHYKETGGKVVEGTPLEEWPLVSRAMVENLKLEGFVTVEQLAGARDDVCLKFPGLMELKKRAGHYLELAKGNAPLTKLESELKERDNTIDTLRNQLTELSAKVNELSKVKK